MGIRVRWKDGQQPQPLLLGAPEPAVASPPPEPEPLPPRVRRFWEYEEPATPPWRLRESDEDRIWRQHLEARGCWTGL
jgi:hypothetical protein